MRSGSLLVLGVVSALPAQVLVTGGGSSLANAVAVAPDGAVLVVQPGTYDGFTVAGKGLTIVGGAGVVLTGTIDVSSTMPQQAFVLRGLTWATAQLSTGNALLSLTDCDGQVLLEALDQPPHYDCLPGSMLSYCRRTTGLLAQRCARLYIRDCSILCAAQLSDSSSVIESSVIEGEDRFISPFGLQAGRTALTLTGGSTQICGSSAIIGGDGNQGGLYFANAGPGVSLNGGELRALDGLIAAGYHPYANFGWTILSTGTTRISPRVALVGNLGPQAGTDVMPQLTATSARPGGSLDATVTTEVGDLAILVVGLPGPETLVPGLQDPFWLAPNAHVFLSIGVQQAAAPISGSVAVPAGNAFLGLRLGWGAACVGPATGFQATNPSVALVY